MNRDTSYNSSLVETDKALPIINSSIQQKDEEDTQPPLKVIQEEEYVDAMSKIIQRDFYPDLPNLKNKLNMIKMMESGSGLIGTNTNIYPSSLQSSSSSSTSIRRSTNNIPSSSSSQSSWDDITPNINNNNNNNTPNLINLNNNNVNNNNNNNVKKDITSNMSLDQFVANYISEDDNSYKEIQKKEKRKVQDRMLLLANGSKVSSNHNNQQKLAITNGNDQVLAIENNVSNVKNALMYIPEKHVNSNNSEEDNTKTSLQGKKEIVHENTRITSDVYTRDYSKLQDLQQPSDIQTMGLLSTPSLFTPSGNNINGGEGGVEASPLMTWGKIDGTPLLLHGDDTLSNPQLALNRDSFKIPETPHREKLAFQLSDKKNKLKNTINNNTPSIGNNNGNTTPNRFQQLSPAAQKLVAMRSPNVVKNIMNSPLANSYGTSTPKVQKVSISTPTTQIQEKRKQSLQSKPIKVVKKNSGQV